MKTQISNLKSLISNLSATPSLDAQVLLAHITGKPRAWVLAHPEAALDAGQRQALAAALTRLESGEPLPYVLGHWEFYGLDFSIDPAVLIPRPETEVLVETALEWLKAHPRNRHIADVGTGSGCIAVTLAVHVPNLHVTATDISPAALQIARANAHKHHVAERIEFIHADLLDLRLPPSAFSLIAANLPYIPTETLHDLEIFGREPTLALDGGPDGLNLISRLMHSGPRYLDPGGLLLVEIEASQGSAALTLARKAFLAAKISLHPDLAGLDRLIRVETPTTDRRPPTRRLADPPTH
ncbi:MAG: peptide chain release factor N(5)-glutamine methyltransferase [Chloroflexi bacterium]|nr:peptide chain release factor N(5)-glutamine methyltransferase [Chloroflexota bacterium]